jgi:hypothetical protein
VITWQLLAEDGLFHLMLENYLILTNNSKSGIVGTYGYKEPALRRL